MKPSTSPRPPQPSVNFSEPLRKAAKAELWEQANDDLERGVMVQFYGMGHWASAATTFRPLAQNGYAALRNIGNGPEYRLSDVLIRTLRAKRRNGRLAK